jgi:hypothetical protein
MGLRYAIAVLGAHLCLPLAFRAIGVPTGMRPSTLLLGQGGDEFAAEVGDVWDHPTPDQVRSNREKLEQVFAGLLGCDINRSPSSTGVPMGVVRDSREDGRWVASAAFEWAHASWDNV